MEEDHNKQEPKTENKLIKMKKFPFIMGIFLIVFLTAGITTIALTFGDEKVESLAPVEKTEHAEFQKLYDTYDTLKKNFYKDVDDNELVDGAINGMIQALDDPYSTYMDEEEAKSFNESISSSFEGIGAEIQEHDKQIMVVSPIKGAPAEKAGVKPNDIILSVDGDSLEGLSSTEAVMKIRGKKGTKVELMISRGTSEPLKVTIVRDTIPIETVYAELLPSKIAKIQVTSFSDNTTEELKTALSEMEEKGMKGVILDLRGNPGGLLSKAQEIASIFVPKGENIYQVENRAGQKEITKSDNKTVIDKPVVVLIDGGSASASEIVAAAVSESADIQLVGEKSFGKGTVQTADEYDDGSNFKFTAYKWLTPDGNWIHGKGIEPDVKVSLPKYASLAYISPDKKMKETDTSTEIKTAEQMLEATGFDPGKVDGFYDEATKTAVSDLQKEKKLEVTGVLEGETTIALMEMLREKILANDTQVKKAESILEKEIN